MLGLDEYGSSDEEETQAPQPSEAKKASLPTPAQPAVEKPAEGKAPGAPDQKNAAQPTEPTAAPDPSFPDPTEGVPTDAPAPGPSAPPVDEPEESNGAAAAPQSPHSATRAIVRDLTMPPVPSFEIPPSPPGSPPPKSTKQFAHFLELKKKGVHFNQRLENSSALRNPSLLHKLRGFASIDDEAQYATTLPSDVAVPTVFPSWAYAENLGKSQREIARKREEEQKKTQREALEFVPASDLGSSGLGIGNGEGISMAERVRAGLSREGSGSPQVSDSGKRKDVLQLLLKVVVLRNAVIGWADAASAGQAVIARVSRRPGASWSSAPPTPSPPSTTAIAHHHTATFLTPNPRSVLRHLSPHPFFASVAMNHLPQAWGRPRDDVYGAYDHSFLQTSGPMQHTQQPIVTGTSVVAVKYKDGVVIAADNLASYGSLARFTDVKRLRVFNNKSVVGFGGDVSDMQYLDRLLTSLSIREDYSQHEAAEDDVSSEEQPIGGGASLNAKNLHTYLSKVLYKRRSDFNPLWNVLLIAGFDHDGKTPFLALADLLGTTFSAPALATGFGAHLATPILRKHVPDEAAARELSRADAVQLVKDCMKTLFYRDARSLDRYSIAVIERGRDVDLRENEQLENQSWAFAERIRGYGTQIN
ncbi:proteasome component pre4 [Diplodia corticola]|uniref:Proteasome component pre4 n=1 Tax=Diplodia corticola TaxID=236234 RepID=A0A1J9RR79_9PEZI|nr:proteasome component pre4 [Diplodia corticola]OJD35035.1 proteasome component pre4 [Diplodia corticola]